MLRLPHVVSNADVFFAGKTWVFCAVSWTFLQRGKTRRSHRSLKRTESMNSWYPSILKLLMDHKILFKTVVVMALNNKNTTKSTFTMWGYKKLFCMSPFWLLILSSLSFYYDLDMFLATRDVLVINGSQLHSLLGSPHCLQLRQKRLLVGLHVGCQCQRLQSLLLAREEHRCG